MHSKLLSALMFVLLAPAVLGQPDEAPKNDSTVAVTEGDTLVSIAPCRVLDTAMQAGVEGEGHEAGQVDVRSSRCGRIIPSYATAYSVRVTRIVRGAPEKQPEGSMPVIETSRKVPVPGGDSVLHFPTPASQHVSVDIDGYYVPAGVPIWPAGTSFVAGGQARTASQAAPGAPVSTVTTTGSTGSLYLDGLAPGLGSAGVALTAVAANPSVVARTGSATSNSGFAVVNSADKEIFAARSDGSVLLPSAMSFLDGRSDFFGSPGTYYGYVSIPLNVIHDTTLVSPRDAGGGATNRLRFYNAESVDELGSPAITKYRAFTSGYYAQENVNFESVIHYHRGTQYHYRARSNAENKDTFWVKAATNFDSITNTTADMFVSGRVGIGTTSPVGALQVEDLSRDVDVVVSAGDNPYDPHRPTLTLMRKDGNNDVAAKYGLRLDARDENKFKLLYGTTPNEFTTTILSIDTSGNLTMSGKITAGTVIGATYQDVAEWVPSATNLDPGTVVVLDELIGNGVKASTKAYDSGVAGVVSYQPGIILGVEGPDKEQVATTGRVRVRVDASAAAIKVGDLLVTGNKPGTAMKSIPLDLGGVPIHRPGTIVGKALEAKDSGEGEILVLLSLQ